MVDPSAFLDDGLTLHGHRCPAMAMGLRAGAIAMKRLGVGRSEGNALLAMVELGDHDASHCFGDGVQEVTGCTYGKGNMRQLGYGQFALTLVDATTSRAVKVVLRAEVLSAPKAALFDVRDVFDYDAPPNAEDYDSFVCWLERMWAAGAIPGEKHDEIGTAHDVLSIATSPPAEARLPVAYRAPPC